MPATFSFVPSYTSKVKTKARVRSMSLGNGYVLRVKDGINNMPEVYDLLFDDITDTQLNDILTFLRTEQGVSYFLWTPPLPGHNTQKKFVCDEWDDEPKQYNCNRLVCTFSQVFDP